MKKIMYTLCLVAAVILAVAATDKDKSPLKADFVTGNPGIASMNSLSFGPDGILFVGDSDNATIFAIDTKDTAPKDKGGRVGMVDFDGKAAAALGTTPENVRFTDFAVNPISKSIYISVHTKEGTPILLKLVDGKFENVDLTNLSYSKMELSDAIAKDAKDRRGRPQRRWAISDMKYHNGKVMVSGLSNKEFSSSFRSIDFPFNSKQEFATLEIYHAAHGRYETYAPIKTFDVANIKGKGYLLASYTCTPLVLFPMEDLKGGKHLKGRTIAELGYGNSPVDIVSFKKEGKPYFLMANTNRPVMLFDAEDVKNSNDNLTKETSKGGIEGVSYTDLPMVNVLQLDNLDSENVVYLQRTSGGDMVLRTRPSKWLR